MSALPLAHHVNRIVHSPPYAAVASTCPWHASPSCPQGKTLGLADSLTVRGLTCWGEALKSTDSWLCPDRDAEVA